MKKDAFLPGVRVSIETKEEYFRALEYYDISNAEFVRAVISCMLSRYRDRKPLPLVRLGKPVKTITLNPPLDKR